LPPEVRGCPADRVLAAAREAFAEPGYDWRRTILLSPPPPPVVQRTYAGVPGLESEDLVTVAYALIASGGTREGRLLETVGREIERRNETHHLVTLRTTRALHERGSFVDHQGALSHAEDWVTRAEGWPEAAHYWYSPEPF
jgi:hypothetical protein